MNDYYERIEKMAMALAEHNIPHTIRELWEGAQIRFPWCKGDVACHAGTYGCNGGMVETYQFPWDDDDVSMLTPEKAVERIVKLYKGKWITTVPKHTDEEEDEEECFEPGRPIIDFFKLNP